MRIAIISDIHGNLEAFRAVLQQTASVGATEIYCLGDIVGYGPFPDECVDLVRERCAVTVMGNHDAGFCGKSPPDHFDPPGRKSLELTKHLLKSENLRFLSELPLVATAGAVTLAHASPLRPESWGYIHSMEDARAAFGAFSTPICCIGHTHVPAVIDEDLRPGTFRTGRRMLINVGSVGQPRDGRPEASFGLLDLDAWAFEIIRTGYDVSKTIEAIHRSGLPSILGRRLMEGL